MLGCQRPRNRVPIAVGGRARSAARVHVARPPLPRGWLGVYRERRAESNPCVRQIEARGRERRARRAERIGREALVAIWTVSIWQGQLFRPHDGSAKVQNAPGLLYRRTADTAALRPC